MSLWSDSHWSHTHHWKLLVSHLSIQKKEEKNPSLSCSSSCGPSLSLAQEEELVTGDLTRCCRVRTHGTAHRPLAIRISKIHFSPGAPHTLSGSTLAAGRRRTEPLIIPDRDQSVRTLHPHRLPTSLFTCYPLRAVANC